MNRLFTLCMFLIATSGLYAQKAETFQFVDIEGNVIEDGSTVVVNELVEDEFMGNFISTGLFVLNTSEASASVRLAYEIETLDNGSFQICFPENCISKMETGSFITTKGTMAAFEQRDLQCEWFPEEYGFCKATLAIEILSALGTKIADGPSINIVFNYADPAGIENPQQNVIVKNCYNLQGHAIDKTSTIMKGISIRQLSDGRTIKCLTK